MSTHAIAYEALDQIRERIATTLSQCGPREVALEQLDAHWPPAVAATIWQPSLDRVQERWNHEQTQIAATMERITDLDRDLNRLTEAWGDWRNRLTQVERLVRLHLEFQES